MTIKAFFSDEGDSTSGIMQVVTESGSTDIQVQHGTPSTKTVQLQGAGGFTFNFTVYGYYCCIFYDGSASCRTPDGQLA